MTPQTTGGLCWCLLPIGHEGQCQAFAGMRPIDNTGTSEIERLRAADAAQREEIQRLRRVCAEAYQLAGAVGAPVKALENLAYAAQGAPDLPHATFLPILDTDCSEIQRLRKALTPFAEAPLRSPDIHKFHLFCFGLEPLLKAARQALATSDQPAATPTREEMLHGAADMEAIESELEISIRQEDEPSVLTAFFNGVPITVPAFPNESLWEVTNRLTVSAATNPTTQCSGVSVVGWEWILLDAGGVYLNPELSIGYLGVTPQSRLFAQRQPCQEYQTKCGTCGGTKRIMKAYGMEYDCELSTSVPCPDCQPETKETKDAV